MSKDTSTTIVVTCMERRWPLVRLLKYFESQGLSHSVLIADQSKEPWDKRLDFPGVRYNHMASKDYNFYEMWEDILQNQIQTEYVCWNNDDDFTTGEYVKQASKFLDKNPDYTIATGETYQYGNHPYGKSEWLREVRIEKIKNPAKRVLTYFDGLFANPHVIVRRSVFLTAIKAVILSSKESSSSLAPIKFWDKIFNFYALTLGNKKTLDCLGTIRCNRKPQAERYKGTGSLMTILNEYPKVLEVNTEYTEIIKRISAGDIISSFFKEHNPDLSDIEIEATLKEIFTSPLGVDPKASLEEMKSLPSMSKKGKKELETIDHFINLYSNA